MEKLFHIGKIEIPTDKKIKLGYRYSDVISDFEGIATGYTVWISGCHTVGLDPGIDKDGKLQETQWFDVNRLIEISKSKKEINKNDENGKLQKHNGGPQLIPKRNLRGCK